jgi:hypothetical protein
MHIGSRLFLLTCGLGALIAAAIVGQPRPAQAQFGINIGGFPIGINIHGGHRYRGGRRHRGSRASRDEAPQGEETRPGKPDKVVASEGAPSSAQQTKVLQKIASSATVTDVGSTKDLNEVGQQALTNDKQRDYTSKITEIITAFKNAEKKGREESRQEARREGRGGDTRTLTAGDVTTHGIEQSLEKAIKKAKLDVFERFVNEAWTSERIRVMILDRVLAELPPLFEGNNRGLAPMEALDGLIQRAAEGSYRRVFETSEFLAANRSSALFIQRVYQTHGALVSNDLREASTGMLTKGSMIAVGPYETAMRRDANGYALRYRAQRIVFDCLSNSVEALTSSETKIRTVGEIENKLLEASKSECVKWLERQFGSPKGELEPQKPYPMRVIWSAEGPKDDPSMYGRVTF